MFVHVILFVIVMQLPQSALDGPFSTGAVPVEDLGQSRNGQLRKVHILMSRTHSSGTKQCAALPLNSATAMLLDIMQINLFLEEASLCLYCIFSPSDVKI